MEKQKQTDVERTVGAEATLVGEKSETLLYDITSSGFCPYFSNTPSHSPLLPILPYLHTAGQCNL